MSGYTASHSTTADFKLGDWWVRPLDNEVERAGKIERVEARSMDVLVCLARHAPAIVAKERIFEEVWADSPYTGDEVISHAIWELRKALGDAARDPVYIQTIPRKGYRLVAEVLRPQGAALPIEGVRINHYDLGEEIGRGAMGVVYKAVDRRLGRTVAIKFLASELTRDPRACQRFEREARLAASLDHPNLATVHEVGETTQGYRYIVSAFYSGGSLKGRLADGAIAPEEAVSLARQLLAGLIAAHERAIVHRDIKPANLLLDQHGTLKICDFGIAKLLGGTDLTRTGTPLGTPAYQSPEQSHGHVVDHRTDLWSVGVVLFELLTGRRPTATELGSGRVAEDASVPALLREFLARVLDKDPEQRYQSAAEMLSALELSMAKVRRRGRGWQSRYAIVAASLMLAVLGGQLFYETVVQSSFLTTAQRSGPGWDHLEQGKRLWLGGNDPSGLDEALEHFQQAVELLPDEAETHAHLAAFLAEMGAFNQTSKEREKALEHASRALFFDSKNALAHAAQAWIYLLDGDLKGGEREAREAIRLESECPRGQSCDLAYLWLGEALWLQNRPEQALEVLRQGAQVGDGRIRCRLKQAQILEKLGDIDQAEVEYRRVLTLENRHVTALKALGNLYLRLENMNAALGILRRLYDRTRDPDVMVNIAYVQYSRGLWVSALDSYQIAHDLYWERGQIKPTLLTSIGDVYLEMEKPEQAHGSFRDALKLFDAEAKPSLARQAQRAVCLAKLGRVQEADREMRKLMAQSNQVERFPDLLFYAGRIAALKPDRATLFELARRWVARGGMPARFKDDPAFIPYRLDPEYLGIIEPDLVMRPDAGRLASQ